MFCQQRFLKVLSTGQTENAETVKTQSCMKPASWDFWLIAKSVLNKGKSVICPLINRLKVLPPGFDKAKLFLRALIFVTLKLYNIFVIPKIIKKVIIFNMCLKESYFPVSPVVSVFKNVGERPTVKIYCPISLLSVVSNVFEKLLK